jgi:acyl-coenzyme A thioesterase PaaI-like protein
VRVEVLPVYKDSFFTSPEREDGLKLTITYREGMVLADLKLDERFDAGDGYVYGGLLFGVMDVLIWYVILMEEGKIAMTRKIDVDFFIPVLCGRPYCAKARVEAVEEKDIRTRAWIEDASETVCTQVKAVFREGRGVSAKEMVSKLDFKNTSPKIKEFFDRLGKSDH